MKFTKSSLVNETLKFDHIKLQRTLSSDHTKRLSLNLVQNKMHQYEGVETGFFAC